MLRAVLLALTFAWPISEIALALRLRARRTASSKDRGSTLLLLAVIVAALSVAPALRHYAPARIEAGAACDAVALACLLAGVALRWASILTLGRLFTVNVAIDRDHSLVLVGPFRWVRHPAYTGLLLAFLGVGLSLRNWLSLAVVMVPISLALLYRIEVEERALSERFGEAYARYAAHTKRLIPGIW